MNPLIPAIISSIIETIQDVPQTAAPQLGSPPGLVRPALQDGPLAVMGPPKDGHAQFGNKTLQLSASLQIRDTQNRIVMPFTLQNSVPVLYKLDGDGSVQRVWVLTSEEAEVAEKLIRQKSSAQK